MDRAILASKKGKYMGTIEDDLREMVLNKEIERSYQCYSKQSYVDEFLSMKCCGDVLNVCNPIGNKARKEISESMALIKRVKHLALKDRDRYNVLDLCAGNALTSVLAVHLLPIKNALAIDKRKRVREWRRVKRFEYVLGDIYDSLHVRNIKDCIDENTIIVSSHPCGQLAREIVKIYWNSRAKALFIIPCCDGKLTRKYPQELFVKMGHYWVWCYDLAKDIDGNITTDEKCLSPKNIVVSHIKGK